MDQNHYELFERWVIAPYEALRALPKGDGAFAVMSMSFGLYERFLISRLKSRNESANDDARWEEASVDLEKKVTPEDFKSFWEMYRVGMQHYFQPKQFTKGKDNIRWGWDISEGEGYEKYPKVLKKGEDLYVITINPWAFAEHVINRWKTHPELMNEVNKMRSGKVRVPRRSASQEAGYSTSSEAFYTYKPNPDTPPSTGYYKK